MEWFPTGKPNHQDITVTKYQDLASCNLINNCNTATTIPTVTITVGQNDNGNVTPTWVYVLTNALISSISVGGGGSGKPLETVTFNYTAISWTYKQQAALYPLIPVTTQRKLYVESESGSVLLEQRSSFRTYHSFAGNAPFWMSALAWCR